MVTIGHLEFKLLSTFTMNFSLLKPDFAKYFTSETKYSIAITANDSVTKKFPVLEDGPLKVVTLFWCTQFDELAQLKNFKVAKKFIKILLLLSGDAKNKWINTHNDVMPTMKILPKFASMQCGLPSLSTTEHPTKLPKDYETFNEKPRNQPI
jgi:hypothetical protein